MELKTLKEISFHAIKRNGKSIWALDKNELKAEAVKWVKFNLDLLRKQKPGQIVNEMNLEGRIWMLGRFFNLTEEDLK